MAQNHIQSGRIIQFTNLSGSTITSGEPVVIGTLVGVALGDIADDETGSVAIEDVWELPKASGVAISQGASVYLTATGTITTTATDNTYTGKAFLAAATGDATVQVKLNV
jgi:predicted RecA/RadA family phage recombinase